MASEQAQRLRLHVFLSRLGLASRREAEEWIRAGKVQVNGRVPKLGELVDPRKDHIKVKGKLIHHPRPQRPQVIALHKPKGVITTVKDPQGRNTVMNLVPKKPRLFPVGRLDANSEGLLLMTNDGELAHRLMHPQFEVPKIYEVKIRGNFDEKKIAHIQKGLKIGDEKFQAAEILDVRNVTKEGLPKYKVKIRVYEGKNHHVRRLFDALKCRVVKLKRIAFGPISLKGIPYGEFRVLSSAQIKKLRQAVGLESIK